MRKKTYLFIKLVFVVFMLGQSPVEAGDALDYLKRLLQGSLAAELSSDDYRTEEGVLQVARRPDVNTVHLPTPAQAPTPVPVTKTTVESRKAEAEAKVIESKINRQLSTLQRQLEREESALEARLKQLSKQREAALIKGDEKQLNRIQTLEATAIKEYEKRVERILAMAASTPQNESATNRPSSQIDSKNARRNGPKAGQQPPGQPERPRRRRRLWPFS